MPRATLRVRVPFVDVDASQRIHYTAWFRYMEFAEHHLMREIGIPYATGTALDGYSYPRVHLEADFQGAIGYDDELEVEAWIERVGSSSWTVAYAGRHAAGSRQATANPERPVLASGKMTIVCMDPQTQRPAPLPQALRAVLEGE
jgi:4-hydroxybenzoyl-CoA thioesterase/acyl-CoA thioester hydrolase